MTPNVMLAYTDSLLINKALSFTRPVRLNRGFKVKPSVYNTQQTSIIKALFHQVGKTSHLCHVYMDGSVSIEV